MAKADGRCRGGEEQHQRSPGEEQRPAEERSKRQSELTALLTSIKAAVEQINKGEYARALKTYAELLAKNVNSLDNVKRIKQSAHTRFLALAQVWREEIDAGRYMPRRVRGSCRGRELG